MGVIGQKWLYSVKSGSSREKVVVIGQKWLYSGKSGCIRAKVVVFGQKWLDRADVVVFWQSGFIRANWLYLCKMVFFTGKSG